MSRRISSSSRIRASSGSTRKTSSSTNSSSCDAAWCFGVWAAGEGFFIGGGAGRLRVLLLMAGRGTSVRPQGLECCRREKRGNEIPANFEGSLYFRVVNFLSSFFFFSF